MQNESADHLHVEWPLAERAFCRFAHERERFDRDLVERRAALDTLTLSCAFCGQLIACKLCEPGLQSVDFFDFFLERPQGALLEHFFKAIEHTTDYTRLK